MASAGFERERELFDACVRLSSAEREEFLQSACAGDGRLRDRIHRLLQAHDAAGGTDVQVTGLSADQIPDQIGPYRITAVLGEGGMGVVYEAEQSAPVRRSVALKVIRAGMDTAQVIARFRAERQALAVLDHPYIAKVYDAGETPQGRPWFAMELVRGVPLCEYCDANRLTVRQRVELVVLLCHAIQHAHQKGVVHRDLKPGNILVTSEDLRPFPRVIDFGIARAIGAEAGATGTLTRVGQAIGTPAYMSPEQASGNIDIDTRTDIYSIGVILFELLTGVLPADPREISYHEFLARLASHRLEAPRMSSRVRKDSETAARRSTTPERLARELKSDVDHVVCKAMQPKRELRYETAAALADDLERYLADEPVTARAATPLYRIGKFVRRYRAETLATSVALAALLSGTIAATVGLARATRAEQLARREAVTSARIADFLVDLFDVADPGQSRGETVTAKELVDRGARTVADSLKDEPEVQARMLDTLSRVHLSLGTYREALDLANRSMAALRTAGKQETTQHASILVNLGRAQWRLGRFNEARANLEGALAIRVKLMGDSLETAEVLNQLGGLEWQLDRLKEALAYHERALAMQERVAGPDHPDTGHSLRGQGNVYTSAQNPAAALEAYRRAQEVFEQDLGSDHPLIADNLDSIGLAYAQLKKPAEARAFHTRSLDIRRRVLGSNHPVVAYSLLNLARLEADEGRPEAAAPLYEEGIRIREKALGTDHPRTADIVESYAILQARLGNLRRARELFERSLRSYRRSYGPRHSETLESHRNLAILSVMDGRPEEALQHLRRAMEGGYVRDLHLEESTFDPIRSRPAFRQLERDVRVKLEEPE